MPRCYSYCRWSSTEQDKGDSLRRQMEMAKSWVDERKDEGFFLDKTEFIDRGKSGLYGENLDPEHGMLAQFIEKARNGEIEKGSYLIIEKLDRFSRAEPLEIGGLISKLIKNYGINLVILTPVQKVVTRNDIANLDVVMLIQMELQLAHASSKEKSYRISKVWEKKRKEIKDGTNISQRIPAWTRFDEKTKKITLDKNKTKIIEYIFKRTIDGVGQIVLCKELTEQYPPISQPTSKNKTPKWNKSYISKLLSDRRLLGEYQPYKFFNEENDTGEITIKKNRRPFGPPIKGYYPQVISEETFYAAQASKHKRTKEKTEERMEILNLFRGLIFNKYSGNAMHFQTTRAKRKKGDTYIQKRLCDYGHLSGDKTCCPWSIEYYRFERLLLEALSEIDAQSFSRKIPTTQKEIRSLRDQLVVLDKMIEKVKEQKNDPKNYDLQDELLYELRQHIDRKKDIDDRLEKLEVTQPTEAKNIVEGLRSISSLYDSDTVTTKERRRQIRDILPYIVKRIEILPFKKENRQVAAVIAIDLADATRRICWLEKRKEKHRLFFTDKNHVPVRILCKDGIVWFALNHKGRSTDHTELRFFASEGYGHTEEDAARAFDSFFQSELDFKNALKGKQYKKWAKVDLSTIFSYAYHGEEKATKTKVKPTKTRGE